MFVGSRYGGVLQELAFLCTSPLSPISILFFTPQYSQSIRFYILTAAFALANIVSASTAPRLSSLRDLALPQSDVAQSVEFPATAQSNFRRRRSLGPTNGELMRRGLQPASRPRKLYQARTLAKRQANEVPAGAQASGAPPSSTSYAFLQCGDDGVTSNNTGIYNFAFTDLQGLANQCAAQQDKDNATNPPGTAQTFLIASLPVYGFTCVAAVVPVPGPNSSVTCSSTTLGFYSA